MKRPRITLRDFLIGNAMMAVGIGVPITLFAICASLDSKWLSNFAFCFFVLSVLGGPSLFFGGLFLPFGHLRRGLIVGFLLGLLPAVLLLAAAFVQIPK